MSSGVFYDSNISPSVRVKNEKHIKLIFGKLFESKSELISKFASAFEGEDPYLSLVKEFVQQKENSKRGNRFQAIIAAFHVLETVYLFQQSPYFTSIKAQAGLFPEGLEVYHEFCNAWLKSLSVDSELKLDFIDEKRPAVSQVNKIGTGLISGLSNDVTRFPEIEAQKFLTQFEERILNYRQTLSVCIDTHQKEINEFLRKKIPSGFGGISTELKNLIQLSQTIKKSLLKNAAVPSKSDAATETVQFLPQLGKKTVENGLEGVTSKRMATEVFDDVFETVCSKFIPRDESQIDANNSVTLTSVNPTAGSGSINLQLLPESESDQSEDGSSQGSPMLDDGISSLEEAGPKRSTSNLLTLASVESTDGSNSKVFCNSDQGIGRECLNDGNQQIKEEKLPTDHSRDLFVNGCLLVGLPALTSVLFYALKRSPN